MWRALWVLRKQSRCCQECLSHHADSRAVCELGCLQRAWWGGRGTRGPGRERNRELASDCSLPGQCVGSSLQNLGSLDYRCSGRALVSSAIELDQRGLLGGPPGPALLMEDNSTNICHSCTSLWESSVFVGDWRSRCRLSAGCSPIMPLCSSWGRQNTLVTIAPQYSQRMKSTDVCVQSLTLPIASHGIGQAANVSDLQ